MNLSNTRSLVGGNIGTFGPVILFYGLFNDEVPSLTGTVALALNGNLTGTGTKFTSELRVGDYVVIENDVSRKVKTITSDTAVVLESGKVITSGKNN